MDLLYIGKHVHLIDITATGSTHHLLTLVNIYLSLRSWLSGPRRYLYIDAWNLIRGCINRHIRQQVGLAMSMCRRIRKYMGDENWKTCNRWSRSQRREDSLQVAAILHAIYDSILNKWPPCMHILSRIPRPHSTHSPSVCFLSSSSLFLHYAVTLTTLCYIYIIFIINLWLVKWISLL